MLVLSRKVNESIHVGDDIVVTVTRIDGNKVRLGFTCPRGVPIWRDELRPRPPAADPADAPTP